MKVTHRQFNDIQSLAERIQNNEHVDGDLENFSRFSLELRKYLRKHCKNKTILDRLKQIPDIAYQEFQPSLFQYLRLNGLTQMWKQRDKRKEILDKVRETASIYSSIHFLLRAELG